MLASVLAAPSSSAFAVNLPVLLVSLLNFLLLLLVLKLVFTGKFIISAPIGKWAKKRSDEIKAALSQAETVTAQAAVNRQEIEKKLREAEQEILRISQEANSASQRIQREGAIDARREADALLTRARSEITRSRDEAMEELRREFGDLAVEAGARVVATSLNDASHKRLIEEALKEAERGK